MEHRFRKTVDGFLALTEDEQGLFGVLLTEELQQFSAIEALQRLVCTARALPAVEHEWRGRHYALSLLQGEVSVVHLSDAVGEADVASVMGGDALHGVRQVSTGGLEDFSDLLDAWQAFVGKD